MKITMTIEGEVESFEDFFKKLRNGSAKISYPVQDNKKPEVIKRYEKVPATIRFNWSRYLPEGKTAFVYLRDCIKEGLTSDQIKQRLIGYVKDARPDIPIDFIKHKAITSIYNFRYRVKAGKEDISTLDEKGKAFMEEMSKEGDEEEEEEEELPEENDLGGVVE